MKVILLCKTTKPNVETLLGGQPLNKRLITDIGSPFEVTKIVQGHAAQDPFHFSVR